ncbi:MAG: response regulator [Verrucomicrobiota bacterium]
MRRPKLLILDDNEILAQVLCRLAKLCEWDATFITKPQEAIELLLNEEFDCFLTDQQMPEKNGIDVIRALRKLGNNTPALLMSGCDITLTSQQTLELQIIAFLKKPFTKKSLKSYLMQSKTKGLALAA